MIDFKYFVKIEKAYEESGDWFVEGLASGTKEDLEGCRMSKTALQKFVDGLPLPLTDNHAKGDVLAEMGVVIEAELTKNDDLFIKAKLDKDNPSVGYFVKKVGEGKKFSFSVQGLLKTAEKVYSDTLGKFITEYKDIIPKAISITTRPAYEPSFLQVVSKSYEKEQDNIFKEQEMKEVKKVEEVKEVVVEKEEVKTEEVVEVETKPAEEKADETKAVAEEKKEVIDSSQKKTDEEDSKQEEVVETTEDADEDTKEAEETNEVELLSAKVDELTVAIEALKGGTEAKVTEVAPVEQSPLVQAVELLGKQQEITKALAEEVEILKSMPLQKKTKAKLPKIEKSVEEKPESARDLASRLMN